MGSYLAEAPRRLTSVSNIEQVGRLPRLSPEVLIPSVHTRTAMSGSMPRPPQDYFGEMSISAYPNGWDAFMMCGVRTGHPDMF